MHIILKFAPCIPAKIKHQYRSQLAWWIKQKEHLVSVGRYLVYVIPNVYISSHRGMEYIVGRDREGDNKSFCYIFMYVGVELCASQEEDALLIPRSNIY